MMTLVVLVAELAGFLAVAYWLFRLSFYPERRP